LESGKFFYPIHAEKHVTVLKRSDEWRIDEELLFMHGSHGVKELRNDFSHFMSHPPKTELKLGIPPA
jgi:hypothetical protein